MESQTSGGRDSDYQRAGQGLTERLADDPMTYGGTTGTVVRSAPMAGAMVGENVMPVRNRVQWGPIMAGLLTTIATMIVLTILGLAIGASAFDPSDDGSTIGTAAGIWGAISAIIAFFVGGMVAAKTAAVGGPGSGMINGFMVGATALALILYLTSTGLGNLLGTVGTNIGEIANLAQEATQSGTVDPAQAQDAAQDAVADVNISAQDAFDTTQDSAWGTLLGIVLALGAATVGGFVGHNERRDLIAGTG
ncbi:MAG: hypothetical protein M3R06_01195 [Chloroflexota bacterium]|nr:hypothetical protein [Chloroflexota bacterium]